MKLAADQYYVVGDNVPEYIPAITLAQCNIKNNQIRTQFGDIANCIFAVLTGSNNVNTVDSLKGANQALKNNHCIIDQ